MSKRTRATYSPELRLESAQEVIDQGRSIRYVAKSFGMGKSTADKWSRQLNQEPGGTLSSAMHLMPDHLKIRDLERKVKLLEGDNEILKKASTLLMQDPIEGFR